MKNSILGFFLLLCFFNQASAQLIPKNAENREPRLIVGTAIGFQWFENLNRFGALHVEIPIDKYRHIGFSVSKVFTGNSSNYYYNQSVQEGSYEVGLNSKYFLHGRFTMRKTGFYLGTDIRIGQRKYGILQYDFSTGGTVEVIEKQKTSKFMLSWGAQWRFGRHVILDLGVPLGFELFKSKSQNYSGGGYSDSYFVLLPNMMLGIAF